MGQGLQTCTCTKAVSASSGSSDRAAGNNGNKDLDVSVVPVAGGDAWAPVNAALVAGGGARLALRLAGGAATSYLAARGHVVRLVWSSSKDHYRLGTPPVTIPDVPSLPARVAQIAAGEAHALLLAIDPAPRVFALGANDHGQLGLGDSLPRRDAGRAFEVPVLGAAALIGGVACGGHVSLAVSQRGEVWSWGRNEESCVLGHGLLPVACVPSPTLVAPLRRKIRAVQAATSGWTSLCLTHLGAIFSWGGGACGAHGHGHQIDEVSAKAIPALAGVVIVQVAMGPLHALALSSQGEVFTWGRVAGAFGPQAQMQLTPKYVDALHAVRIVQIAAGGDHSLALSDRGEVYGWGAHASGALGGETSRRMDAAQRYSLVHQLELPLGKVREIGCGRCHSLFLATAKQESEATLPNQAQASNLYLCGQAVPVMPATDSGHPVLGVAHSGNAQMAASGAGDLAPAIGVPLRVTRVDVKRVLDLLVGKQ